MKTLTLLFLLLAAGLSAAVTNNLNRAPAPAIGYTVGGTNYFQFPLGTVIILNGEARTNWPTGGASQNSFCTNSLYATNWTGSVSFSNAIAAAWNADIDSKTNTFAASGGIIVTVAGRAVTIAVPATWA